MTPQARMPLALALVAAAWTLGIGILGVGDALAYLAPALLILLPLVGGRYPGDAALARVVERVRRVRGPAPRAARGRRGPAPRGLLPRGGRLVGAALASRPPPRRGSTAPALRTDAEGVPRRMKMSILRTAAATGALALALTASASAHISADPAEGPADGYMTANFQVPHGCEESPTTRIRIKIPPSVPSVTPGRNAFWELSTKEGRKDRVELHGETITRGISEITYTAKTPLPAHELDMMPVSLKLPAGNEGDAVYFPTIQECEKGRTGWVQIPAEGESADDLESPAPAITLTAGGGGHGGGGDDAAAQEPVANVEQTSAAATTGGGDDDDGAPMWLVVVALAIGVLGLLAGTGGLLASRRATA